MNKSRSQIINGEEALNQKQMSLKRLEKKAFKQASLEGVVSTKMISGILAAQNFSMPAGYISEEGTDHLVKSWR